VVKVDTPRHLVARVGRVLCAMALSVGMGHARRGDMSDRMPR